MGLEQIGQGFLVWLIFFFLDVWLKHRANKGQPEKVHRGYRFIIDFHISIFLIEGHERPLRGNGESVSPRRHVSQ